MSRLFFLAGFLLLASVETGLAANWLVERVSGTAWAVAQGREQVRLRPRMVVPEGMTIATGASGRVRLVSEGNAMLVSPNTRAVVVPGSKPRETFVVQQAGDIEFDIQKRGRPHFSIQTPYLAAVVKGTRFTVSVTGTASVVDVRQGLVSVRDLRSGQMANVGANQRASAGARLAGLQTAGTAAPGVFQGAPTPPTVAPVGRDHESFRSEQPSDPASPSAAAASTESDAANGRSGMGSRSSSLGGLGGRGDGGRSDGGRGGNAFGRGGSDTVARGDLGRGNGNGNGNSRGRQDAVRGFGGLGNGEGHGNAFGADRNGPAGRDPGTAQSDRGRSNAEGTGRGGGTGGRGNANAGGGNAGGNANSGNGNGGGANANAGGNGNGHGNGGAHGNGPGNASNTGGNGSANGNAPGNAGNPGGNGIANGNAPGNPGGLGSAGGGVAGGNGNNGNGIGGASGQGGGNGNRNAGNGNGRG